jgi:hypothetical protein
MTERPRSEQHAAIRLVSAGGRRATGTSRNPAEVAAVLAEVAAVIEQAEAGGPAATLGIVSPFRDQVDAIRERLIQSFSAAAVDRHEIVVGTAHSLQGDEKDLIILSTSIDPDFHFASLCFLENPNLFNVAVTRARQQMVVVTSVGVENLPPGVLRDYLQQASGTIEPHAVTEYYDHDFERRVAEELRKQGVQLWPNFRAAGLRIDLAASRGGSHLAVLCDGPSAGRDLAVDALTYHRLLTRAGWQVARIPRRSWLADWYACVKYVLERLGN